MHSFLDTTLQHVPLQSGHCQRYTDVGSESLDTDCQGSPSAHDMTQLDLCKLTSVTTTLLDSCLSSNKHKLIIINCQANGHIVQTNLWKLPSTVWLDNMTENVPKYAFREAKINFFLGKGHRPPPYTLGACGASILAPSALDLAPSKPKAWIRPYT